VTTAAILAVLTGLRLTGPRRDYALALAQHAIDHEGDLEAPGAPPMPDDLPPEPYKDPAGRYVIVDGVMYERPERDRPKALPPGPSAGRSPGSGPVPPAGSPEDAVDTVMAALDRFEDEFGSLDEEDDA
jgi:hypothetical protein